HLAATRRGFGRGHSTLEAGDRAPIGGPANQTTTPQYRAFLRNHYCELAGWLANSPDPQWRSPGQAVDMATKALELDPQYGDGHIHLGVAQYRAGDGKAALASLKKGLELGGEDEEDEGL